MKHQEYSKIEHKKLIDEQMKIYLERGGVIEKVSSYWELPTHVITPKSDRDRMADDDQE